MLKIFQSLRECYLFQWQYEYQLHCKSGTLYPSLYVRKILYYSSCILRFMWFLANRSKNRSRFKAFALLDSILSTPRLFYLPSVMFEPRKVFTSFRVEKLTLTRSQDTVLTGIATAILQSLKSSKNASWYSSINSVRSTTVEGLCIRAPSHQHLNHTIEQMKTALSHSEMHHFGDLKLGCYS